MANINEIFGIKDLSPGFIAARWKASRYLLHNLQLYVGNCTWNSTWILTLHNSLTALGLWKTIWKCIFYKMYKTIIIVLNPQVEKTDSSHLIGGKMLCYFNAARRQTRRRPWYIHDPHSTWTSISTQTCTLHNSTLYVCYKLMQDQA